MAIYAGGIVLNDVFDFDDRPPRAAWPAAPLGAGSRDGSPPGSAGLRWRRARSLAALSGSWSSFVVALILAACVLGYDAGLKRTAIGAEVMGVCRALNLLLGMSQATGLGGPTGWMLATAFGVFVFGVTLISRSEVEAERTGGLLTGMMLQDASLMALMAAFVQPAEPRWPGPMAHVLPGGLDGILALLAVAAVVNRAGVRALRRPTPGTFQAAVKTGVLSLVWIDVATVAAFRGPAASLAVAALWVPAFLLARRLYAT